MFILSKNCFALVLAFGLLLSNMDVSGALKCYQCPLPTLECGSLNGTATDCTTGLAVNNTGSLSFPKEYAVLKGVPTKRVCVKLIEGSKTYKLCHPGVPYNAIMQCLVEKDKDKTSCICDTDLCNHGPTTRLSQLLLAVLGLTTLLAYHRNNSFYSNDN